MERRKPKKKLVKKKVATKVVPVGVRNHVCFSEDGTQEFWISTNGVHLYRSPVTEPIIHDGRARRSFTTVVTGLHQIRESVLKLTGRTPAQLGLEPWLIATAEYESHLNGYNPLATQRPLPERTAPPAAQTPNDPPKATGQQAADKPLPRRKLKRRKLTKKG